MPRKSYIDTSRSLFKFHPMSGQRIGDCGSFNASDRGKSRGKLQSTKPYQDAPVWIGCKCSPSAINGESTEGGLLEEHLDLSEKNVSHMIEVQKLQ